MLVRRLLSLPLVSKIVYCSFVSCTATIKRFIRPTVSLLSERFRLNCRIDDLPDYQIMISIESARSHSNACEHKFALIDVLILYDVSIIICIDPPTGLR